MLLPLSFSRSAFMATRAEQGRTAWLGNDRRASIISLLCICVAALSVSVIGWTGGQRLWAFTGSGAFIAALTLAGTAWLKAQPYAPPAPVRVPDDDTSGTSGRDRLTGLLNRRAFLSVAEDALHYFQRYRRGFAMLMIEVDDIAPADRALGPEFKDIVRTHVADVLDLSLRRTDKISRFAGERFAVVLREISEADTLMLSDRMRKSVEDLGVRFCDRVVPLTISIGATLVASDDTSIDDVMTRADTALGSAKASGRNCVVWLAAPSPNGLAAER